MWEESVDLENWINRNGAAVLTDKFKSFCCLTGMTEKTYLGRLAGLGTDMVMQNVNEICSVRALQENNKNSASTLYKGEVRSSGRLLL